MNDFYTHITIVRRELYAEFVSCLKEHGVSALFGSLCNGTAQRKTLEYLGLEETEKVMITAIASGEEIKKINHDFIYRHHIDVPGNGIALSIPVTSMGSSAYKYLVSEQMKNGEGERRDMNEMQYALITVICESGGTDAVMDAARSAGARGGTVVHAKGTANDALAQSFFGISIGAEKEIIYIVSKKADKDAIMKAVFEKAGANTPTKAVLFSMPVDTVVGLRSVTEM